MPQDNGNPVNLRQRKVQPDAVDLCQRKIQPDAVEVRYSWLLVIGFLLFPRLFTTLNKAGVLGKVDASHVLISIASQGQGKKRAHDAPDGDAGRQPQFPQTTHHSSTQFNHLHRSSPSSVMVIWHCVVLHVFCPTGFGTRSRTPL
jgi:hypothetical protein